jgi:putative ATP-dependent endonuclease of OLD family
MKLNKIRISGFQSFGVEPTEINLNENITYLIGANGSGKTAVLQALCRLFAFDQSLRRVQVSDFHVPSNETHRPNERKLWIEVDFTFPETETGEDDSTIPPFFRHMRLVQISEPPVVRFRLDASIDINGEIEEKLNYVLEYDTNNQPSKMSIVPRHDKSQIHVHYLPSNRNPERHVAFNTNALLGRLLRSIHWGSERDSINELATQINSTLSSAPSILALSETLNQMWSSLHKGKYFSKPEVTFSTSELESLLKHLSLSFSPSHDSSQVDFTRLSDGQKSLLYLTLVLASHKVTRSITNQHSGLFDEDKLRPPIFTIVAVEEPENSLSPHYLGRISSTIKEITKYSDAQALITTHSPSMLYRVAPEDIQYLRLSIERKTIVKEIILPPNNTDAYKYIREAVQAYPEIYFARLIVLGEGDSEQIVLPRILEAKGVMPDIAAICITPLGGRHVNHFWRLLNDLNIPYVTLLDLDMCRHQGGWGRIKYVNDQLREYRPMDRLPDNFTIYSWDGETSIRTKEAVKYFEHFERKAVFFSAPLDLDFAMIKAYAESYEVEKQPADKQILNSVLGDSHHNVDQYEKDEKELFYTYRKHFKNGSKPATHIEALSKLTNEQLLDNLPKYMVRLVGTIISKLEEIPE